MSTEIAWTDETWNPTVGCSRVSPGCDHCYAIGVAHRAMQPAHEGLTFRGIGHGGDGQRPDWTGEVRCLPDRLDKPLHWRKPRRVFVDSMSDLFHPDVPSEFISKVFQVMGAAEQHTFQVLTKRPQRMAKWVEENYRNGQPNTPNIWLGTSVENQRYADLRIPHLLETPAAVRFLSVEPLLGPIDLLPYLRRASDEVKVAQDADPHLAWDNGDFPQFRWETGKRIDWVIIGGESGPGARPMEREWAQDIVDVCRQYRVPVFVKQLGTVLGGKRHADIDTFPASLQVREFPYPVKKETK